MSAEANNDSNHKSQNPAPDKSAPNFDQQPGIELDEHRRFGSSGAWAPQGGQSPNTPERNPDGSPAPSPQEPTHHGRTQSTTNSQ